MGVTITRRGPGMPRFDGRRIAAAIKAYVPGAILERTSRGISSTGAPFAPYSQRWREALAKGSEDQRVDLRLTGGMLNSTKAREATIAADVVVVVAPDTGTSPQLRAQKGKMRRTGGRGPAHNVLGGWLHDGTARMPARPWLGLTPDEEAELWSLIDDIVMGRA